MRKRKTCGSCRALVIEYVFGYKCSLGFPTKRVETGLSVNYIPCGELRCPKPLTYGDLIFERRNLNGNAKIEDGKVVA